MRPPPPPQPPSLLPDAPLPHSSVLGPLLWSLMATQLFFCSGHWCEFSGLQYNSAFIGYDDDGGDVEWLTAGALLSANTAGMLLLACVSLPLQALALHAAHLCDTLGPITPVNKIE